MAAFFVSSSNFKHKDLEFLNQGFTLLFTNWMWLIQRVCPVSKIIWDVSWCLCGQPWDCCHSRVTAVKWDTTLDGAKVGQLWYRPPIAIWIRTGPYRANWRQLPTQCLHAFEYVFWPFGECTFSILICPMRRLQGMELIHVQWYQTLKSQYMICCGCHHELYWDLDKMLDRINVTLTTPMRFPIRSSK